MKNNHNFPLISIALATYNGEKYLLEQLDSLVFQTYQNIEIIVSDDGSSDNTLFILNEYSSKYNNFHIYKNNGPKGIKNNFTNAFQFCKGEYISFSDQDDIWMLDKIEKLYMAKEDFSLVYHDSLFIDEAGNSLNKTFSSYLNCYTGFDARALLFGNCISGHALLVKKNIVENALPFPDTNFHDWWIAFKAADNGGVKFLNEVLVKYRQHTNSETDFLRLKNNTFNAQKLKEIELQDLKWYETCANAETTHKAFFQKWFYIFKDKNNHIWNFKLFLILLLNMRIVFFITKKSRLSIFINLIKRSWGNNTKDWFNSLMKKNKN